MFNSRHQFNSSRIPRYTQYSKIQQKKLKPKKTSTTISQKATLIEELDAKGFTAKIRCPILQITTKPTKLKQNKQNKPKNPSSIRDG